MGTNKPRKPAGAGKKPKPGKPADSFLGWLGRQVGHVKHAVQTDVTRAAKAGVPKPRAATPAARARPAPRPGKSPEPAASKVVYRDDKIEQVQHPTQPGVVLRRTIIDEVIVEDQTPTP